MNTKSQLKIGISLNYVLTLISNIAGFLLVPFMIKMLGKEGYGLYESIGAIAGYMAVLDFGVNSTITRYIAKYRAEKNEEKQKNFLALCLILYSALAIVVFIAGYVIWLNLDKIYQLKFTQQEIDIAKIMFMVLILNIGLSLPLRSFGAVMNGYEKFAFPRILNIIRVLLRVTAIFVFLDLGYGVITIVIIDTILNLGILCINMLYVLGVLKVEIRLENLDMVLVKEIFLFSLPIFLIMVYDQIFWKVDQTIISIISGTAAVALVGAAMRLTLIFMRFSTSMSEVFLPRVTKMVVNNATGDELTELMIKVGRIQLLVLGVILSGYLLFGQNFFQLWIGRSDTTIDTNTAYLIGAIIMIPLVLPLIQNIGISILVAKNKHRFRSTIYFIIAVLNIGLTIFLVNKFGIIGASIATAIALIIGNGIIINIYYSRVIGLKITRFFKDCLLKLSIPIMISSGFGYLIMRYLMIWNHWWSLLLCCFLYAGIYFILMWFIGMNTYEKDMIKELLGKITHRGKA